MNNAEQMESICSANAKQSLPYIPFFYGDFLAKTTHLDGLEKSAYMLCIMHLWQYEYASAMQLQRICRANFGQWRDGNEIWEGIREFFKVNDEGMYYLSRVMRDKDKAKQLSEKRRVAANAMHEKRKKTSNASAEQMQSNSNASTMHSDSDSDIKSPLPPLGARVAVPSIDDFLAYCQVSGGHFGLTDHEWTEIYNNLNFVGWLDLNGKPIDSWKHYVIHKGKQVKAEKQKQITTNPPQYKERATRHAFES